ncbi:MAG: glycosyltransferase family 1 protein [Mucilaginibacter sp.]|uniref:glycosyltransferase family 4 protein n=1 Tax=Mucilaginibacter sp. TaxID=1882438 RepID=UPI00326457F5
MRNKTRIGLMVDLQLAQTVGGTYTYYNTLLNAINEFDFNDDIEIVNIVLFKKRIPVAKFKKPVIFIRGHSQNPVKSKLGKAINGRLKTLLKSNTLLISVYSFLEKINSANIKKALNEHDIDLIYYLKPDFQDLDFPFIVNHWDIGHRSTYAFPEVTLDGNYELREDYYTKTLKKAFFILCESEAGKAEFMRYYPFFDKRLKVLPIFGNSKLIEAHDSNSKVVFEAYNLSEGNFFIYPAQFWALKNHYNLILAFRQFISKPKNDHYKLVLAGSDQGNLNYIKALLSELSLTGSVIITGFISEETLKILITNAVAMVMPTFLGPTNMPLIEAAELGCPVLCSDLDGHREIMGESALYFEPTDTDAICNCMELITSDPKNRQTLIQSASALISASKFQLNKSLLVLNNILSEAVVIRRTWGKNE